MSKRIFLFAPIIILFSTVITLVTMSAYKKYTTPKNVHYHAGFQVYVDAELQDFSDNKYMHENPCTVNGKPVETEHGDEQIEKAHLHDHIGNVVHVHRDSATWNDLFTNIGYEFPKSKDLNSFVNGKEVDDIFNYPIKPYDSVVLFLGKQENKKEPLGKAVQRDAILREESKSETCGN